MARLLLLLFFVALMGFTAQAVLFGKRSLPDPGQRIDSRNAILCKLFGKGEDMNKYEARAFNWEEEYVPDFMPEEGTKNKRLPPRGSKRQATLAALTAI